MAVFSADVMRGMSKPSFGEVPAASMSNNAAVLGVAPDMLMPTF